MFEATEPVPATNSRVERKNNLTPLPNLRGPRACRVLTLNAGSSSLKFSIHELDGVSGKAVLTGTLQRISDTQGHFEAVDDHGTHLAGHLVSVSDHDAALAMLIDRLPSLGMGAIEAVGHRIVQGGPNHVAPELITPELVKDLQSLRPLDPNHLPVALQAIKSAQRLGEDTPQVACFDTAFHRTMPKVARQLPLPRELSEPGLVRYGFHGLSYEFIMQNLKAVAGPEIVQGKVIIAHLGHGASMAAVHRGQCVDTTMGLTPAGGLMMGTRPGDLDPGVIDYLIREKKIKPEDLNDLIFQRCGLKGVSGFSSDIRNLLSNAGPASREAVNLFCYTARKALGALVSALDGVETIVFTGGIGEHAPLPRAEICKGLAHLGLELDPKANDESREVISRPASRVCVRVMKTNEELVIAQHTARVAFA